MARGSCARKPGDTLEMFGAVRRCRAWLGLQLSKAPTLYSQPYSGNALDLGFSVSGLDTLTVLECEGDQGSLVNLPLMSQYDVYENPLPKTLGL